MTSVLITGASGFLGTRLLDMIEAQGLRERHDFFILTDRRMAQWNTIADGRSRSDCYDFDDVAKSKLAKIDVLVHLGAFIPKSRAEANDIRRCGESITNTQYLLEHLPNARRSIFASSVDVYGTVTPLHEAVAPVPATLYGASKLYCEHLMNSWAASRDGASSVVLRIGHLYGPGQSAYRKLIPETIRRLLKGCPPSLRTPGTEMRSVMYVDDCCRAILTVLADEHASGLFNLASATPRSVKELADVVVKAVEEVCGTRIPTWSPGTEIVGQSMIVDVSKFQQTYGLYETDLFTGLTHEVRSFV